MHSFLTPNHFRLDYQNYSRKCNNLIIVHEQGTGDCGEKETSASTRKGSHLLLTVSKCCVSVTAVRSEQREHGSETRRQWICQVAYRSARGVSWVAGDKNNGGSICVHSLKHSRFYHSQNKDRSWNDKCLQNKREIQVLCFLSFIW